MYKFHCDYVSNTVDAKLLFTDTDSLVYEISDDSDSVYKKCFKDKHSFDYSGYQKNSGYYDISSKKVLGKMKDEFNRVKINEFVGLKPEMYSLISVDNKKS